MFQITVNETAAQRFAYVVRRDGEAVRVGAALTAEAAWAQAEAALQEENRPSAVAIDHYSPAPAPSPQATSRRTSLVVGVFAAGAVLAEAARQLISHLA
jgi:hypothetical protein